MGSPIQWAVVDGPKETVRRSGAHDVFRVAHTFVFGVAHTILFGVAHTIFFAVAHTIFVGAPIR